MFKIKKVRVRFIKLIGKNFNETEKVRKTKKILK